MAQKRTPGVEVGGFFLCRGRYANLVAQLLLRHPHRPVFRLCPFIRKAVLQSSGEVGVFVGDVVLFARIGFEIVERQRAVVGENAFPAAVVETGLLEASFVEFPVEQIVLGLFLRLAEERGDEADGVASAGTSMFARSQAVARKSPK